MLVYYLMFATVLLLYYINFVIFKNENFSFIRTKRNYLLQIGTILSLLMGLRAITVGIDLYQYNSRYENAVYHYEQGLEAAEWGYNYLSYFFHDILKADYQVFIFFVSAFCVFAVFYCIYKYSEQPMISIMAYLCLDTFTINMSGLRQTLAISITLIAIHFVIKRKLVFFILLVLLASVFHKSALIFLPVYFLWGLRLTRIQAFLSFVLTVGAFAYKKIIISIADAIAHQKYDKYDLYTDYKVNILVILVPLLIVLFCSFYTELEPDGKMSLKHSFFYLLSCCSVIMLICAIGTNQIGRLSYYFSIGIFISLSCSLIGFRKIEKIAPFVECVILILIMAYFIISTPDGTLQIDEYKFYWQ